MARNLQDALLEVRGELQRLGLQVKTDGGRKRARRKRRRHAASSESSPGQRETR